MNLLITERSRNKREELTQKDIESTTIHTNIVTFKSEQSSKKFISKNYVGKYSEGLDLANNQIKNDDRIGHSLNVTHIGSIKMKNLQNLAYFLS